MDKAQAEADRARVELRRARALDEYAHRLATLEAAISATSEALQWRQKAFQELEAADRNVELLQVSSLGFEAAIRPEAHSVCRPLTPYSLQASGDRSLLKAAQERAASAREAAARSGEDDLLRKRLVDIESAITAASAVIKLCEECEAEVTNGKMALEAGGRDEVAGHCRAARKLLDSVVGGVKSEALRGAVEELEKALGAGKSDYFVLALR